LITEVACASHQQIILLVGVRPDLNVQHTKLQDFINGVNAQKGKKVSAGVADSLISMATQLLNDIGCR
jgi:hypothetical protein